MKATINRHLFAATVFDSGSLGMLTSVVHQFTRTGRYQVVAHRNGQLAGSTAFEVSDTSSVMQLDIDLASLASRAKAPDCECDTKTPAVPAVSSKGYVLFYASSGSGGYSATAGEAGSDGKAAFDSTNLGAGDLFVLSLLEPTRYSMANRLGTAKGHIEVSFSQEQAKRLKSLETQNVELSKDGFKPSEVKLTSTQGLVFHVRDSARVVIEKQEQAPGPKMKKEPVRFNRQALSAARSTEPGGSAKRSGHRS